MNLTTEETEEILQLIEETDVPALKKISVDQVSLGAALELACYRATLIGHTEISGLLDEWAARVPVLSVGCDSSIHGYSL